VLPKATGQHVPTPTTARFAYRRSSTTKGGADPPNPDHVGRLVWFRDRAAPDAAGHPGRRARLAAALAIELLDSYLVE
jgi:hypothetical protein